MQQTTVIKSKTTSYVVLQDLGSGTYGRVVKAYDQNNPTHLVAIKLFHLEEHEDEGVPATSIRELDILRTLNHPNIVDLYEVHYSRPRINVSAIEWHGILPFSQYNASRFEAAKRTYGNGWRS